MGGMEWIEGKEDRPSSRGIGKQSDKERMRDKEQRDGGNGESGYRF